MRFSIFFSSFVSIALFLPTTVAVQAEGTDANNQTSQTETEGSKNFGRNSRRLPDVVVPNSMGPPQYILEKLQAGERPQAPDLPDVAVRPDTPDKPERPDNPVRPDKPEKPGKPDKPDKPAK